MTTSLNVPKTSYLKNDPVGIGKTVLMRPLDFNLYELLALSEKGEVKARRVFTVEDSEIFFKFLDLSEDGILSGLLCFQDEVKIVSWRSDRLVQEELQ